MNQFFELMEEENNYTETENGAKALSSTLNSCLDMFGSFGAMRNSSDEEIINTFKAAFAEDKETAMRMLFYFRDIREGQGVRRPFRVVLTWLAENYPKFVTNNFDNVFEFGRCDDLLCLLDTKLSKEVVTYLIKQLKKDQENMKKGEVCSLLAKWMPSENASSKTTKHYAETVLKYSGMTGRTYRKLLSSLRKYLDVTEVKMAGNEWDKIDFEKVPGKASINYADAFYKHQEDRYSKYLIDAAEGKASVNAAALYPVDIIHKVMNSYVSYRGRSLKNRLTKNEVLLYDSLWKALPNYFEGRNETGICVVDVSGSMYGTPIEVAVSLGLYCADKCQGPYKNKFITFSEHPQLVEVQGENIKEKVEFISKADWDCNTNIEAVFDLILDTAVRNHCKQEEIPQKLYIISDMQFDEAREPYSYNEESGTFMAGIKQRYAAAGYNMPTIVYWNVRASECGMFQDTFGGENCCMVSGYSPVLFQSIIDGTEYKEEITYETDPTTGEVVEAITRKAEVTPLTIMHNTVYDNRYDCIWWRAVLRG